MHGGDDTTGTYRRQAENEITVRMKFHDRLKRRVACSRWVSPYFSLEGEDDAKGDELHGNVENCE